MGGPIIRHALQIGYDDTLTVVGQPLGRPLADKIQPAIEDLDARLDALEGLDAAPLTGVTLDPATGTTGRMSDGAPNTFVTLVAGNAYNYLVESLAFTLAIPAAPGSTAANRGQYGSVRAIINGVASADVYNLETSFDPLLADGAQAYPPDSSAGGEITITSVEKYGASSIHQIWKGTINIASLVGLVAGENSIVLEHYDPLGAWAAQTSNVTIIFYDVGATHPSIVGTPTIVESAFSSTKFLSGVQKYSLTDTFDITASVAAAFDNTFHNTPLLLTMTPVGITDAAIAYNDADVVGPAVPPAISDAYAYTSPVGTPYEITIASVLTEDGRITATGQDPFSVGVAVQSASENRMVNTYGNVSTALIEEFRDENRRLSHFNTQGDNTSGVDEFDVTPAGVSGVWTSATALDDGEALQFNDGLVYPTQDFDVGYLPATGTQPDYSAFAADQYYVRAMVGAAPHNSGILNLVGWLLAQFDTTGVPTAKVELKIPTQTGWLDLGTAFNAGTFTGVDGDGCRTSAAGALFGWSSGGFSTASSSNMYILRITLLSAAAPILTRIQETVAI